MYQNRHCYGNTGNKLFLAALAGEVEECQVLVLSYRSVAKLRRELALAFLYKEEFGLPVDILRN